MSYHGVLLIPRKAWKEPAKEIHVEPSDEIKELKIAYEAFQRMPPGRRISNVSWLTSKLVQES